MIIFPQIPMDLNMQRLWTEGLRVAESFHSLETDTRMHEILANGCKYSEVERLVALGARVSEQNREGDTAVHVAFVNCVSGRILDLLIISYLRETRRNLKNENGLSVLHIACSRPHLDVVKKIAEWNAKDLNCQSDVLSTAKAAGCTPLHIAVKYDRYEIAKYLLETCRVDFCVQNKYGSTPLHIALDRRSIQMIDLILAHNHDYQDVADDSGLTHFMAACSGSSSKVVVYYLNHEETWVSKKALIDAQVDGVIPDYDFAGYTAMHFASKFGRYDTMKILLLYCGTSCFKNNCQNLTPLVLAVRCQYYDIAHLLLQFYRMYRKSLFARKESLIA